LILYCAKKVKFCIYEIETDDSIEDSHTESQWKTFGEYAKSNDYEFVIVVPVNSIRKAMKRIKEIDVEVKIEPIA